MGCLYSMDLGVEDVLNLECVDMSHFLLLRVIGRGGFGKVQVVESRVNGSYFALKTISKGLLLKHALGPPSAWLERDIMSQVSSSFLVHLHHAFQDDRFLYLVMNFIPGGDLRYYLRKHVLTEDASRFYFAEMLLALEALHSLDIVYRDLKPENVLLDEHGHIRLSDFGLAARLVDEPDGAVSGRCGTSGYMAPEMLTGEKYRFSPDMYALGVCLYEMLHQQRPIPFIDPTQLEFRVDLSEPCVNMLLHLLQPDPASRIGCRERGIDEIKAHPWLNGIDWDLCLHHQYQPPFVPDINVANCDPIFEIEDQVMGDDDSEYPPITPEQSEVFRGWEYNVQPHLHEHDMDLVDSFEYDGDGQDELGERDADANGDDAFYDDHELARYAESVRAHGGLDQDAVDVEVVDGAGQSSAHAAQGAGGVVAGANPRAASTRAAARTQRRHQRRHQLRRAPFGTQSRAPHEQALQQQHLQHQQHQQHLQHAYEDDVKVAGTPELGTRPVAAYAQMDPEVVTDPARHERQRRQMLLKKQHAMQQRQRKQRQEQLRDHVFRRENGIVDEDDVDAALHVRQRGDAPRRRRGVAAGGHRGGHHRNEHEEEGDEEDDAEEDEEFEDEGDEGDYDFDEAIISDEQEQADGGAIRPDPRARVVALVHEEEDDDDDDDESDIVVVGSSGASAAAANSAVGQASAVHGHGLVAHVKPEAEEKEQRAFGEHEHEDALVDSDEEHRFVEYAYHATTDQTHPVRSHRSSVSAASASSALSSLALSSSASFVSSTADSTVVAAQVAAVPAESAAGASKSVSQLPSTSGLAESVVEVEVAYDTTASSSHGSPAGRTSSSVSTSTHELVSSLSFSPRAMATAALTSSAISSLGMQFAQQQQQKQPTQQQQRFDVNVGDEFFDLPLGQPSLPPIAKATGTTTAATTRQPPVAVPVVATNFRG